MTFDEYWTQALEGNPMLRDVPDSFQASMTKGTLKQLMKNAFDVGRATATHPVLERMAFGDGSMLSGVK